MTEADLPDAAEIARLTEIAELGLLDGDVDALLQDATRQVSADLSLPISLVSIVLDGAQYFVADVGLGGWLADSHGTPVEWAFCSHAVRNKAPFIVEDAEHHLAVQDNPLVTQEGIRCYLGVPLITSRGHALGTLCAIGTEARTFTDAERDKLEGLAARIVEHLERRAGRVLESGGADA